MIDVFHFKKVLVMSLFFGGLFTVTLPLVATNKLCFLIWYSIITVCERGFLTVGPPILIILYGLEDGTKVNIYIYLFKAYSSLLGGFSDGAYWMSTILDCSIKIFDL